MNPFIIISTIVIIILTAIPAWYSIPDESRKWFFETVGFPLGVVPFILWSVVSASFIGYHLWRNGRVIGASIYNGFKTIIPYVSWKKENTEAVFKCSFDADVFVEKLKPFINTAPTELPQLVGKAKETPLDFLQKEMATIENAISEAAENGKPYPKFIFPKMAAIQQLLPDAPDPSLKPENIPRWMKFIGRTKAKIVTGDIEIS